MRRIASQLVAITLTLGLVLSCSEDEGSTVSDQPNSAGTQSHGGNSPSAGSTSTPKAGSSSSEGGADGSSGVIPTEACMGLPIELGSAGAADQAAGGAGGAAEVAQGGADQSASAGAAAEAAEACTGVSLEAETVPVDLFVMMDRSQSMGFAVEGSTMTRWEALRDAVQSFVEDPGAAELRAGIGFFSLSGVSDDALDCQADAYAEPAVPIGLVSEVGPDLVAAFDDIEPAGLTPTVPAVQGAVSYARAWAADNPERATLVVLVSDGFPTQCNKAPDAIAAAARDGYDSPEHIRTFVIGVGDVAKFNLDNYARAGGTAKAFLTDAGDVTASFVAALGNISNSELACEYRIPEPPEGMKLDTEKVSVIYTPGAGSAEEVPSIGSLAACANNEHGGWYYDDPSKPSKITVCPCTCARLQAGRVDVRLGCKPRLGLR